MLSSIRHRGPDGEGIAVGNRRSGVFGALRTDDTSKSEDTAIQRLTQGAPLPGSHDFALVAARYGVVDRSSPDLGPFVIGDGAMVGVLDGRIHNAPELRDSLSAEGFSFRTGLDVEVLLNGYRCWGNGLWRRLNGFWAVAIFDVANRAVILSRDRLGIAPLYYRQRDGTLCFGSTIASVTADRGRPAMCRPLVRGFIDTGLKDFDGRTCWESVRFLEPGVVVELGPGDSRIREGRTRRFWHVPDEHWTTEDLSFEDARIRLRDTLFDAVKIRLRSERDLAFELSGGIDSSAVVAAAAAQGEEPTTYTLKVPGTDEEPFARTMRDRYRIDYRVVTQDHGSFPEHAGRFAELMEEPFRSANVWEHQRLLRHMKRHGADVVLTGSGDRFVFAGDEFDFWSEARSVLFDGGRGLQARACGLLFKFGSWTRARRTIGWMVPSGIRASIGGTGAPSRSDGSETPAGEIADHYAGLDYFDKRIFDIRTRDLLYTLHTDDHLFASVPMEMRTPLLDHRLVELGLRLPPAYLFRRGYTKWILRKAMEPYVPSDILWRREKLGFPYPLRAFLREHREYLTQFFHRAQEEDLLRGNRGRSWQDLLATDPQWLWRVCSTGLWMDVAGIQGDAGAGGRV